MQEATRQGRTALVGWGVDTFYEAWRYFGSHVTIHENVCYTGFTVWAPRARRVSVVGDFNGWDTQAHCMAHDSANGTWTLSVAGIVPGSRYQYAIETASGDWLWKCDPYARSFSLRPEHCSRTLAERPWQWGDADWMRARVQPCPWQQPVSIYEVHLGAWQRTSEGGWLDYRECAHALAEHVRTLGFTHVELMPVMEHWLDDSWGYQVHGFYAPTSRYGATDDLRYFVDVMHRSGIGVILDWVPGHFPKDPAGLACFDGLPLYEYDSPQRGEHRRWGTAVFNYASPGVRSFLCSNALYWLQEFHFDGLRVDAVASMLYLDYDRDDPDTNAWGGNEHVEALDFLRALNVELHARCPGIVMIAEESTAWAGVSRPVHAGGLGFGFKWNMGWMNDLLRYMRRDPVHRRFHHNELTFSRCYAYTEQFVLALSHDEVVHGKAHLVAKMPGNDWQRRANLRLLLAYLFTHPGKKHLFMGMEWGQTDEWNVHHALPWHLLRYPEHTGILRLVGDLNRSYRSIPAWYEGDGVEGGFEWIDCHDAERSVISFIRYGVDSHLVCVLNFTPVPRHDYRLALPQSVIYRIILNTDDARYGGASVEGIPWICPVAEPLLGHPYQASMTLPPLSAMILMPWAEERAP